MNRSTFKLADEVATEKLGADLAEAIKKHILEVKGQGLNIRLIGELGAGKTFLTRSFLRALGFNGPVRSPTFSLLQTYPFKEFQINHFDFYRFEEPEEFEESGFRENFGPGLIAFTEWTNKAFPYVPGADIEVQIKIHNDSREAIIKSVSELGNKILEALK